MDAPQGPYIKTTYFPDGTMKTEPVGFGGELCKKATEPYAARQGGLGVSTPTAEAGDPTYLERERADRPRAKA
jgi:hypothetical protein